MSSDPPRRPVLLPGLDGFLTERGSKGIADDQSQNALPATPSVKPVPFPFLLREAGLRIDESEFFVQLFPSSSEPGSASSPCAPDDNSLPFLRPGTFLGPFPSLEDPLSRHSAVKIPAFCFLGFRPPRRLSSSPALLPPCAHGESFRRFSGEEAFPSRRQANFFRASVHSLSFPWREVILFSFSPRKLFLFPATGSIYFPPFFVETATRRSLSAHAEGFCQLARICFLLLTPR